MTTVEVGFDEIPERFKDRPRWLLWDAESEERRPYTLKNDRLKPGKMNNESHWLTFDEAKVAAEERDSVGIGYAFRRDDGNEEYVIDVDGAYSSDGEPRDWFPGLKWFKGGYVEWSPSKQLGGDNPGLHAVVEGTPPDFWSDIEADEEGHEGVDVLDNVFCSFTGNVLAESEPTPVEEADAVHFLYKAHKNIKGESPLADDKGDGSSAPDDDLTQEQVEDALSNVDESLAYNDWLRLGFALYDWDSGSTGKSVFEDWSSTNAKWDKTRGQRHIDDIWDNDSANGKVSVGTLVHLAKDGGWEPPWSGSETAPAAEINPDTDDDGDDTDNSSNWDYTRHQYDEGSDSDGRQAAANALEAATDWMYVMESEKLWVYDDDTGYFNPWGEEYAGKVLESALGSRYSTRDKKEVIERLQVRNQTHREDLNARTHDGVYLCVGNGVVDLSTGELKDHDPDYKFTRGLKWDYDPAQADPEPIVSFLDDITKREADRDTILDHLAHGLMPGHPYRAFIMTYGPGGNGKTRLGKLLRGFVGPDNAAAVELQDLTGDDDFATGALPGAFVNVGDDVSISELRDVSKLKSATGDGTVRANRKHEKKYDFQNEAAMFFSANEPPRIAEESDAIGERLYPIEMPFQFKGDKEYDPENPYHKRKDPKIVEKLLDDEAAMRGLLMLCIKHSQELIASNGEYSMPEGSTERRAMYEAASDPIYRFAMDYLEPGDSSATVLKDDAYDVYKALCEHEDERVASADVFKKKITQQSLVDVEKSKTRAMTPGDGREPCWRYVEFASEARDLMPARLQGRYFPDETDANEAEGDAEPADESDAYGAVPISEAAAALTGYVTVTVEVAKVREVGDGGVKATVKDATGAIDVVAWNDPLATELEAAEGECLAIRNGEVTEYEGTRELSLDAAIAELVEIQSGVGYATGPGRTDGQDGLENAAADGGTTTDTDGSSGQSEAVTDDIEDAVGKVREYVRLKVDHNEKVSQAAVAGATGLQPGAVQQALQNLREDGTLQKDPDGDLMKT
jgi:P4 family phage/plasmid primase-like protien